MPNPMDANHWTSQARKCRRLAKQADEETARVLLALAEEYEANASKAESGS